MVSSKIIKIKTVIKQNSSAFLIVIFWFTCNYIYFFLLTGDSLEAGLILFYFKLHESLYGNFYSSFTEFIIFGLVFSIITIELFRKYNPADTSRELAKAYGNHIVIVGYNHLGQRIAQYLQENSKHNIVVIEKNRELVQDLIDNEEAVVNDNALNMDTLLDAGVNKAKVVFVMSDDLELQLVVNANIRELNKDCILVCRVFEEDIGNLLSRTYKAKVISSSKFTAKAIFDKIKRRNCQNILLIGMNHITLRIINHLKNESNIEYHIIEENEEKIEESLLPKEIVIMGDPKDEGILQSVNIQEIDYVVNIIPDVTNSILITRRIRDFNQNCKIISRFFLESVAEILERPPFRSKVISSSKQTIKVMIKEGIFNF